MKIEITDKVDNYKVDDISTSKLILIDELIQFFMPLFSEEIDQKKQQLEKNKQDYYTLRKVVTQSQDRLESLDLEMKREKIIASILKGIDQLLNQDVLYGRNRSLVLEIYKNLQNSQDIESLMKWANTINILVQKNVSKIIK